MSENNKMKYHFVNRLQDFEFHDTYWEIIDCQPDRISFVISYLNVRKSALEEDSDKDMEISDAHMTFYGVSEVTYEPSRTWKKDDNGNSYSDEPQIIHTGETAQKFLISEMKNKPIIYNFDYTDSQCKIGGCGEDPYFTFCISFQRVEIVWESFKNIAWYERERNSNIEGIGY